MALLENLRMGGNETMHAQTWNLLDLPNEILQQALYSIPTSALLRMRAVNHRFCNVIERIVHERLLKTVCLDDWKLIIEFYHPSRMRYEKYNLCHYLGTPGLDSNLRQGRPSHRHNYGPGWLTKLHARFRPTNETPERSVIQPQPTGDIPGARTMDAATGLQEVGEEYVERNVYLESHENFSQFIFSASLVQLGPAKGVFNALAEVIDKKTIRLFRAWLSQQAQKTRGAEEERHWKAAAERKVEAPSRCGQPVWVDDNSKAASLSICVKELRWRKNAPILVSAEEDEAVTYSLELIELEMSLLHLLLALERNLLHTDREMGKAMIFGSFPTVVNQTTQAEQRE